MIPLSDYCRIITGTYGLVAGCHVAKPPATSHFGVNLAA